ncbi:similar to Saccharomyces cerevisiae YNL210W MER1 Protein with RNA-binding motifs required for meiosis-specific mRNA splicing [Maudiozyma saulgeensis]|uniref:Similar to Saccharomyces cerevisiae YNL210W MER1 Protein with RNA-binding motifs required for meiosis-specific mRNA splicing n=1 Tax=Maudiozyma saulgeensis TaxID=1789683 RepID=A0A1X7R282_9SACH|nr:similar to Saccharomyces cerevisiae YNL210W MER1 Protein with RNA-binding motifs required for meiosis-specific mRNA splicing [Kazachstania saulgeensis]
MAFHNSCSSDDYTNDEIGESKMEQNTKDFVIYGNIYRIETPFNILVEIDIWTLNLVKKYTCNEKIDIEIVNIIDFSSYIVLVPVTKNLIEILNLNGILKIHLPKPLCQDSIPFPNDYIVSNCDNLITFLIENTSQLYEILLHYKSYFDDGHLIKQWCFTRPHMVEDKVVPEAGVPEVVRTTSIEDIVVDDNIISDNPNNIPEISSIELCLNKLQISYLIGKEGYWVNFIREFTDATIKILPIPKKLTVQQISSPRSVFQTIIVTGTLFEITNTLTLIESTLTNMKYSRS